MPAHPPTATPAHASRPRRGRRAASIIGGLLITAGLAIIAGLIFAPQALEQAYGNVRTTVISAADDLRGTLPTIRLGATGGIPDLDRCDGTFTEMTSYEHDGVPPVWAAHNNCQGDVILPLELGQQVQVEGDNRIYEVVDIRPTPKVWATTDDLVGLNGELALQTCFYGEDRMRFVALESVGG
ncbi:MAG: hypothetical protein ACTH0V_05015 [Microbacteriaceae bacterium]